MDIQTLTAFFMWCTIINTGLFALWAVMCKLAPDLVYRTQRTWFPIPRETFDVLMYAFFGAFKTVLIVFVIVPYVALLIVG